MSVLSPEATPDKALRIFVTLVRDQEAGGSNPLAPTTLLTTKQGHYAHRPIIRSGSLLRTCCTRARQAENHWDVFW